MLRELTNQEAREIFQNIFNSAPTKESHNEYDNSILFDACQRVSPEVKKTTQDLLDMFNIEIIHISKSPATAKTTLQNIVYNLFTAWQYDRHQGGKLWVGVSLDKNDYKGVTRWALLHFSYTNISQQIKFLEHNGYIDLLKGYHNDQGEGRRSRIRATPKLELIFARNSDIKIEQIAYRYPVLISGIKNGFVEPTNKDLFKRECAMVDLVNASNQRHLFRLESNDGYMDLDKQMKITRKYQQSSMQIGGRFYCRAQQIKKELRSNITIDLQPTREADYSATHPTILYAEIGLPVVSDPYSIDSFPRSHVKMMFMMMLNNSNKNSAIKAMLSEAHRLGETLDYRYCGRIIDVITEQHKLIAHFFYTDAWQWLQKTDSDIAALVMKELIKINEAVLPIHDSFVVREDMLERLIEIMKDAFKQTTGQVPLIKVI